MTKPLRGSCRISGSEYQDYLSIGEPEPYQVVMTLMKEKGAPMLTQLDPKTKTLRLVLDPDYVYLKAADPSRHHIAMTWMRLS